MSNDNMAEWNLPKNIRQIGTFGEKYKVYIEDFVYTYVHRFIHQRRREDAVLAAVLLGQSVVREDQEYVFISGAQKVDFSAGGGKSGRRTGAENNENPAGREYHAGAPAGQIEETGGSTEGTPGTVGHNGEDGWAGTEAGNGSMPDTTVAKQAEFWDRVYQGIKQSFDNLEILGWYFNLDGSSLEINSQLQHFFESTYKKGSRFLYFEDCAEQVDAFFVQEQHRLQRLTGYAVYYEKNPQMQQFMIEEKERLTPKPIRERENEQNTQREKTEDVVQNYRAIMNKLNEKPSKRRWQPALYVAGAAVLVIVAATAVTQIGNYQSLKTLQQTMQALSGAVSGDETSDGTDLSSEAEETAASSENAENGQNPSETAASGAADEEAVAETGNSLSATGDSSDPGEAGNSSEESDVNGITGTSSDTAGTSASQSSSSASDSDLTVSAASEEGASQTAGTLPSYYVVQKGDNLMAISQSLYDTTSKVDEICALNGIEDMDMIYEGQKLLLP